MADEKIILGEIDIDMDQAINDAAVLKQRVIDLDAKAKEAKKTTGETSKEYIQLSAELKNAKAEYSAQEKMIGNVVKSQNSEKNSIDQLKAKLAAVTKQWNELSEEERNNTAKGKALSKQKLELTETIKKEQMATGDARMNVGNYSEALDGLSGGFLSATKSALKFIATPIGAIIAAIVVAITAVVKAFQRSEESMNKVKQVTGALSGAFSGLINMLKPVVDFIANGVIVVFDTLGKVAEKTMSLVSKGLKYLGFDKAANAVDGFTQKIKESAKAGQELAQMEAELQRVQRKSEKIQLDYQKRAEKLRQQRDDESKSVAERIKLNDELGAVLKEQLNEELKIANLSLSIAEKRVKLEGESTSNLDALAEAQTRVADIQERITGQESEQLANLNSLRKEAIALAEEARKKDEEAFNSFASAIDADLAKSNEAMRKVIDDGNQLLADSVSRMGELASAEIAQNAQNQMEAIQLNYENQQALLENNIFAQLEAEKQGLDQKRQQEVAYAKKIGADVTLVNKKYDKAELALEKAKMDAKMSLAADFFGNIAQIAGEGTAVAKAAAVAQTTIQTYQSATASYASLAPLGPWGIAAGIAAAAAAVAAGLANVKKILSVKSGLPGDSGGGGSVSGGAVSATAAYSTQTTTQTQTAIGNGIVSRTTDQANQQQPPTEKVLVLDEVTAKQKTQSEIVRTSNL